MAYIRVLTPLERTFCMLSQAILDRSFWTKVCNYACYLKNWSSLNVFVLKTLFEKEKYVLAVKDHNFSEQVELESEPTSKM